MTSNAFTLKNLYSIVNNINNSITWKNNIDPIYTKFNFIKEKCPDDTIRYEIDLKQKAIFSQLYSGYSKFIQQYSTLKGCEFAFLTAYGLLINDIRKIILSSKEIDNNTMGYYHNNKLIIEVDTSAYPSKCYFIDKNKNKKKNVWESRFRECFSTIK